MTELTVILALTAAVFGGHPVESIQARNGTTARDFVVEPATLICLGIRVGHRRRREPECHGDGELSRDRPDSVEERPSAAPNGRRKDLPRALHGARRICGQHSRPVTRHRVRSPFDDERSGRRERPGGTERQGANARRAEGRNRRPRAPRLSADVEGSEAGAELHGSDGGVCRRRHGRLERRLPAQGGAWRRDSRARWALQGRSPQLRGPDEHDVRRRVPADGQRHRRAADRDSRGRRRRSRSSTATARFVCST